jgi:hypothetical protein
MLAQRVAAGETALSERLVYYDYSSVVDLIVRAEITTL